MVKVLWISNIPSPYKVELMNLLGQKVELTCCFEYHEEENREKNWYSHQFDHFTAIYLNDGINELLDLAKRPFDILVNSDYSKWKCILMTLFFRAKNKPVILQADGGIAKSRGKLIDWGISRVMKLCTHFLSSGEETDKYFKFYKVKEDKIFHYRFSSLSEADIIENDKLRTQKSVLRDKLEIKEKWMILSVGQQIPRKGFDVLIKAMKVLNNPEIGLYIVGGKPQQENLQLIDQAGLKNVTFVEFMDKNHLAEYYAASDLFALATREDIWGLVINEAMSFGLPIVSTDRCVAAVELINKFENGILVPVEAVEALAKAIEKILLDDGLRESFERNSLQGVREYTIENTAQDYFKAVNQALR